MKTSKLQNLLDMYQGNAYPGMYEALATHLGVSPESIRKIGPGWAPIVKFKKGDNYDGWWAIPARDDGGEVIGLSLRSTGDSKVMFPGSKLGLCYEVNPDHVHGEKGYTPGPHNWVRTMDAGILCPVCGKPDGCLVSAESSSDPKAVVCRVEKSDRKLKFGYLHVLKAEGVLDNRSPLIGSDLPVIIVEGFSDTVAAMDLGFVAVGRPSDQAGMSLLSSLLRGRDAWVVGENDKKPDGKEPGRDGMLAAFQNLSRVCKSCKFAMPPAHVKDLRDWRKKDGITQADLISYMTEHGGTREDTPVIKDDRPSTIAVTFLEDKFHQTGRYLMRQWDNNWYRYEEGRYLKMGKNEVWQPIYLWAKDKMITREKPNGEQAVIALKMDIPTSNNLERAMLAETLLPLASLPCWVNGTTGPDPKDMIVFSNGILNVPSYLEDPTGDEVLLPHTPDLFSTVALPFAFDSTAVCPQWLAFLEASLGDDQDKIQLLKEWFGYCMTSDTTRHKMMYMRGLPGAGKGTSMTILEALIGSEHTAASSFSELAGDFGTAPLIGKQICLIGDARTPTSKGMKGLELLLSMTGEDKFSVNRKNRDHAENVMLIARITIASNSFIEVPDHERAMERRLLLLEFVRSFQGREDTELRAKLKTELPGIALWALEGLRALKERGPSGAFTKPVSSIKAMADWIEGNSPMTAFISECCDPSGEVAKSRLFEAWAGWCHERRAPEVSRTRFYEQMTNQVNGVTTFDRVDATGRKVLYFKGLSLKRWAEKKY